MLSLGRWFGPRELSFPGNPCSPNCPPLGSKGLGGGEGGLRPLNRLLEKELSLPPLVTGASDRVRDRGRFREPAQGSYTGCPWPRRAKAKAAFWGGGWGHPDWSSTCPGVEAHRPRVVRVLLSEAHSPTPFPVCGGVLQVWGVPLLVPSLLSNGGWSTSPGTWQEQNRIGTWVWVGPAHPERSAP